MAVTLTRYGGLFDDRTDAAVGRLDALPGLGFRLPMKSLAPPSPDGRTERAVAVTCVHLAPQTSTASCCHLVRTGSMLICRLADS